MIALILKKLPPSHSLVSAIKSAPFLLYIFLLFFTHAASAQYTVKAELDTNQFEFASPIQLKISASYDSSYQVIFPVFEEMIQLDSLHTIEIINQDFSDSIRNGKIIQHHAAYTITAFDSGLYLMPAFPVIFFYKNTTESDTLYTDLLSFQMIHYEVDTALPIRDIKPPLPLPFVLSEIKNELIIGTIILLLFAALVYFFIKRRKKQKPMAESINFKRPSHEIAFEKLEQLKAKKLWQSGAVKSYHSELSEIFREYLENRFGIIALEATTDEIISKMKIFSIDKKEKDALSEILILSDLVKFAKVNPLPEEHEKSFQKVYQFIQNTFYKNHTN